MKLIDIYTAVLRALSVTADDDGRLYYNSLNGQVPWTLSKEDPRPIVLPTREYLREADWASYAPWHPLSEHLNRGISPIMRATVRAATLRLTEVILSVMEQFIELGMDPARQAKMAPSAQKILSVVKQVDARSLKDFMHIVSKMSEDRTGNLSVISMYMKREGLFNGVRSRVCVVSSPLLATIQDSERKPAGRPIRIHDQTMLEDLIEFILPDIEVMETYSSPSTSKMAPYFDSFITAYEKVATQINKVIQVNRKELKDVEKLKINLDWGDLAEDLQTHRSEIPPLEDSKGKELNDESVDMNTSAPQAAPAAAPAIHQAVRVPVAARPAHVAPQAAPVADDSNLSLADQLRRRQATAAMPPPPPPGYGYPAPPPPGYGYPAPPAPAYAYPQQAPPAYAQQPQMYAQPVQQPQYPQQPMPYQHPAAAPAMNYHRPVQQPQMYAQPGYPMPAMVDPNAPPWMNNNNSTIVTASTAPPVYPGYPQQAQQPMYMGAEPVGAPLYNG